MAQQKAPIIAITGSSGKSTTKEMTDSILNQKWNVLKTPGNKNLPLHIKQTMKKLTSKHQAVLLEVGMGRPGAGHRHCRYMRPDVTVFTNIGTAHYGNLGNSVRATARNKSILMSYMNKNGVVMINKDDANSKWLNLDLHKGNIITVGIHNEADYQALDLASWEGGVEFSLKTEEGKVRFKVPVYGIHNVYNALFAIAIARHFHFSYEQIKEGLEKYQPMIKRLRAYPLANNALLLDDTVNANPESVMAAIDVLKERGKNKKTIMVLGSMLELGELSEKGHKDIGTYLAQNQIDVIYTFGIETLKLRESAIEAGFDKANIHFFTDRYKLHEALLKENYAKSVILIKGSAGAKMGLTAEFLKQRLSCSIQIREDQNSEEVHVHPRTLKRLNILSPDLTLHFGQFSKKLVVKETKRMPLDIIRIPRMLTEEISLPDLNYETYLSGDQLHVGPVIGFIVLPVYINSPEKQIIRFENKNFKGLIYMFRPHTDHRHAETINGHYYDPVKKVFVEGTFPYPSAILNRVFLKPELHAIYSKRIGNRIFNYPYNNTDKWKLWSILSKKPAIKKYLPETVKFTGAPLVWEMLEKHKNVYLKPRKMAGGKGIMAIKMQNKRYVLFSESGGRWVIRSRSHLKSLLKKHLLKRKSYIVQQSIFSDFDIGKVDFRAYVQKDASGRWRFTGLESKVGKKGSIISNSKNRLEILPGKMALQKIFGLNAIQSKQKIKQIGKLGIRVMEQMERHHHLLGDAAIDLVMDRQLNIRILEVQINYAAEIKQNRTEDERHILPSILFTPFEYARYLAGFSSTTP